LNTGNKISYPLAAGTLNEVSAGVSNGDFVMNVFKAVFGQVPVSAEVFAMWIEALSKPEGADGAVTRDSLAHSMVYSSTATQATPAWNLPADELSHKGDLDTSFLAIERGIDFSSEVTQVARDGVIMAASSAGDAGGAVMLIGLSDAGFSLI
jgi:hypothetical protein